MQIIVLLISLAGIALVSAAFLFVIKRSGTPEPDYSKIVKPAYKIRRYWMIGLCALGIVVTTSTLIPFPISAELGLNPRVINAVGGQWYWKMDDTQAVVGEHIQFRVTSDDVNHGFAIYNPDKRIIAQTQAMPGYINKLNVTFTEAGKHQILCLEYCGLAHHTMITDFIVTEAK